MGLMQQEVQTVSHTVPFAASWSQPPREKHHSLFWSTKGMLQNAAYHHRRRASDGNINTIQTLTNNGKRSHVDITHVSNHQPGNRIEESYKSEALPPKETSTVMEETKHKHLGSLLRYPFHHHRINSICESLQPQQKQLPPKQSINRERSFRTPRLVDSFRVSEFRQLHQFQMHCLVGMVYSWMQLWYSGFMRTLRLIPLPSAVLLPVWIVLVLVSPVTMLVVLPLFAAVVHNGKKLVYSIVLTVPELPARAKEWWRFVWNYVRERYRRFVVGANRKWTLILAAMAWNAIWYRNTGPLSRSNNKLRSSSL
jgi:hypothetical protein